MKKIAGKIASGVLIAAVLMLVCSAPALSEKSKGATLTNVKGSVTVRAPGQTEDQAAADNMTVVEGTVVKTAGKSSVMVKFADGSLIKIGPFSNMTISKATGVDGKDTKLDISSGKMYARVKKLDSGSKFTVKTPTAIAGVRGTYYSSEVDEDASSRFDVFEGEVAVSSAANPDAEVIVSANQTTTVQEGQAPAPPTALPKSGDGEAEEGISDGEFMAASLEIAISVEPENIIVGGNAVVTVKVTKDGEPLDQEVPLHLKMNNAAVFSNGSNEIDVTTGKDGTVSIDITGVSEENVTLEAGVMLKVKKKKD